jgi:hypothetical protein
VSAATEAYERLLRAQRYVSPEEEKLFDKERNRDSETRRIKRKLSKVY